MASQSEFTDGPISQEMIYKVYDALEDVSHFPVLEAGDMMILDNERVLNGRAPSSDPTRHVMVAVLR